MTRKFLLGLLFCALLLTIAAQDDKSYRADRFDVDVDVQQDRSLLVRKRSPSASPAGRSPSSSANCRPTTPTASPTSWPELTASPGRKVTARARWKSPAATPSKSPGICRPPRTPHTRSTCPIACWALWQQANAADILDYQALPDEYEYAIDSSRVTMNYPPEARLLGEPEVTAGQATVSATEMKPSSPCKIFRPMTRSSSGSRSRRACLRPRRPPGRHNRLPKTVGPGSGLLPPRPCWPSG